ncbi:helix-turn-helix domain-containing protein [Ruegeria atlantica]|uniref:Transcriptional regulator EutR n=1 Tax=Ruegeria atlantica TaxID=81569 RepID=A0A0P1ECI4_9RHOB|nr:helix-turn-helix domain-containing protein [Ruegeria atlantica]CUH47352.1 transcriptional regulator EutR [Ruegeria atlantica]
MPRDGGDPLTIRTDQFTFSDPSEVIATDPGWEYEIIQLSPGSLGYALRRFEVAGIVLEWVFCKAAVAVHETKLVDDLAIVVPLEFSAPSKLGGQKVGFGNIGLQVNGVDFCHRTEPGVFTLFITVQRALADTMGWINEPKNTFLVEVSKRQLRVSLGRIETAVRLLELSREVGVPDQEIPALQGLIESIGDLLAPVEAADNRNALHGQARRNMALVTAVRRRLLTGEWVDASQIDQLARSLGVSQRTLFRAISVSIDMAPRAYQKRLKLHLVQKALQTATPDTASVTKIAMEHGFWHLGRFSQEFREAFGKNPRDALDTSPSRQQDQT